MRFPDNRTKEQLAASERYWNLVRQRVLDARKDHEEALRRIDEWFDGCWAD